MNFKSAFPIIKRTFTEFGEDNVLRLSAAVAYYAMFSIGPLLFIVVGLAGLAFGSDTVRHEINTTLEGMLGAGSAKTVDSMIAARSLGTSVATVILGTIALLFGASGVFGQMQDALNTIWEVKSKPGRGFWELLRKRFLSFSMVLGVGFLLLISLALSAALASFSGTLNRAIPMGETVGHIIEFVVSFGIITLLFAFIFKFMPDVKIPWSKVWVGALGTAFLFTIGKFLLGLYLGKESTSSAYGAAGSVIVILMWVYYASVILFFGAEFTQVYARATGTQIVPKKYAEPVTEHERAEQGIPRDKTPTHHHPQPQPHFQPAHRLTAPQPITPITREKASLSFPSPGRLILENAGSIIRIVLVAGVVAGTLFGKRPPWKTLKLLGKFSHRSPTPR